MDDPKRRDDINKYSAHQEFLFHNFFKKCIYHYKIRGENKDPTNFVSMLTDDDPEFIAEILNSYCLIQLSANSKIMENLLQGDSKYSFTPIHFFVLFKAGHKFLQFFLKRFSHINIDQKANIFCPLSDDLLSDVTPLWIATLLGMTKQMSLLLEYGADPNTINSTGSTPIRLCCEISHKNTEDKLIEQLELLLKHKADVNKPNKFRNTPLMLASYNGIEKIVRILLDNGADPNLAAYCGGTPLHFAVECGHITVIEMLLQHGATLQPDISGFTPLFLAAFMNRTDIIDILQSWMEKSNQLTIEDRIIVYELMAVGCCIKFDDDDYVSDDEEMNETNDSKISRFLRNAYLLRYFPLDYNGSFDNISTSKCVDPKALPIRPKNIHQARYTYDFAQETQTLDEFETIRNDDDVRLHYECLFAIERFFTNDCFKLANCLEKMGDHFLNEFNENDTALKLWIRAIQIKIKLKVFVAGVYERCFMHLIYKTYEWRQFQYWQTLFELAIQYLESFPLPDGLQAMSFQLDIHELCQIEYFTRNDVKIKNSIPFDIEKSHDKMDELWDINRVINAIYSFICYFSKHYNRLGDDKQNVIEKIIRKFLKLNFTNVYYHRHMIQIIFYPDHWRFHFCFDFGFDFGFGFPHINQIKLLLKCGANTNVYDDLYNTPLHYLSYNGRERGMSIRKLVPYFNELVDHIYYGKYVHNALHHFDYADLQSVHLDAVNIYNQTAFHIYPNLLFCYKQPNLNLFPLKCLAARVSHRIYLRCKNCKNVFTNLYEKIESILNRMDGYYDPQEKLHEKFRNLPLHPSINKSLPNTMEIYPHKHQIKPYRAKEVWKLIDKYSERLKISAKLLEFIELHGPCKFIHQIDCDEQQETSDISFI